MPKTEILRIFARFHPFLASLSSIAYYETEPVLSNLVRSIRIFLEDLEPKKRTGSLSKI